MLIDEDRFNTLKKFSEKMQWLWFQNMDYNLVAASSVGGGLDLVIQ